MPRSAIALAKKHVDNGALMASSAKSCLTDAIEQLEAGNMEAAKMWALKSLAYSVGVFHTDYQLAQELEP